jgi:hypothetical protein
LVRDDTGHGRDDNRGACVDGQKARDIVLNTLRRKADVVDQHEGKNGNNESIQKQVREKA